MKKLIIIVFFITTLYSSQETIKIGALNEGVFTSKKEAVVAAKFWNMQMNKNNYDTDTEVVLYENLDNLLKDYIDKKVLIMLISSHDYYRRKDSIDKFTSIKWFLARSNEELFTQYYLIKNKKSKLSLKSKKLNILYRDDVSKDWFETIPSNKNIKMKKIDKDKKLIFDIFFDKKSFSLVRKDVYDSMIQLNPQMKNKITIVKKSKAIFPMALGFDRKNISKRHNRVLNKVHNDINDIDVEINSLSYLNISKIFYIEDKELMGLEEFYSRYFKLKEKK